LNDPKADKVAVSGGTAEEPTAPDLDDENKGAFPAGKEDDAPPDGAGGATGQLWKLLTQHPFLDLYDRHAKSVLTTRGKWCFAAEFVLRLVVLLILLAIIVAVAWKTLAPLPHLWSSGSTTTSSTG
jgi:hypothetical protein